MVPQSTIDIDPHAVRRNRDVDGLIMVALTPYPLYASPEIG